jgi:hypothetical protein
MSGRCRSCNAILEEWEMKTIDPLTGTYTELCDECVKEDLFEDDLWENPTHDPDHIYIEN